MMRNAAILILALGLAACGVRAYLKPQAGQHLPERLSQNSDLATRRGWHRDHRLVGCLRRNALRLGRQ